MDEGVLEAARVIRPNLIELVGPAADELDAQIAKLLTEHAAGQDVTTKLCSILNEGEATSDFLEVVLADAPRYRPPIVVDADLRTRGYTPLPGDIGAPQADRYICPQGDYVWYQLAVGAAIPLCKTHQTALVPG
jgi:hypothetical protein